MQNYNGIKTDLMNELTSELARHQGLRDINNWALVSLYISRACNSLQANGWNKQTNLTSPFKDGDI